MFSNAKLLILDSLTWTQTQVKPLKLGTLYLYQQKKEKKGHTKNIQNSRKGNIITAPIENGKNKELQQKIRDKNKNKYQS